MSIKRICFIAIRTWRDRLKAKLSDVLEHQVVVIKASPSKVALGCALGLGVNFIPTFGFGFLFASVLATVFKGNPVSAAAISLLTGPLIPLKYAFNLLIGGTIQAQSTSYGNLWGFIVQQYRLIFQLGGFRDQLLNFLEFFSTTFMLGAIINAVVFGAALYLGINIFLKKRLRLPPVV
ncbi:MAG: DUF2062 domain-containing protein [Dethiobacter sp.]|jgi:uncharacterized protein (DUF2062 family)|nr:DUF2062 domain-containing protein [Dethiobacter sp.]